jgi:hypothetical protein
MHHKDLAARQHQFIVLGLMDTNEHKHSVPLWSPKNFPLLDVQPRPEPG